MTWIDRLAPPPPPDPDRHAAETARLNEVWEQPKGIARLTVVNNSSIGKWYLIASMAFFTFAGILALLIRLQLAVPDNDLLTARFYNQAFTLHGTAMMFLFAVPIFEAVAILMMPSLLGTREMPFPRLSAFSFWCFVIGGVFVCGSILFDAAPDSGWFMYAPLSSDTRQTGIGTDIWLLGLSFIEVASIAAAVELIVGVLKCRAPGMRLNLMPLYGWYVLVVGAMILFAFPPLIAGDLMLEMERAFDWAFFDVTRGGDPLLWQHLFWIFGHPEVYIVFLPSIALIATMLPAFTRRGVVGHSWIVLSAVGVAFISFGLWVHHMYTTGLPEISLAFFSAASEAVAIPTGIQIFCFIATIYMGTFVRSMPMLFAAGALAIFVFGGLTGVMIAVVPFDMQVHDSHFIVAHLHYTLIGGALFPLFAGYYYWFPFVTGHMLSRKAGLWVFWLIFGGFNIAFLPMHWTGIMGMPRRVWTYSAADGWSTLNLVSTIGAFGIAAGFLILVIDSLRPKNRQPDCVRNPWQAPGLEWIDKVPGKNYGLRSIPLVTTRYPLWDQPDLQRQVEAGEWFLPDAPEGRRELIVTDVLDAEPMYVQRVPGPGWLPFFAAIALSLVFILTTWHLWMLVIVSAIAFVVLLIWWLWTGTARPPETHAKDVGRGLRLPVYASGDGSAGWWAMFITMTGDLTAFLGIVFAFFFFWTVHDPFPPVGSGLPDTGFLMIAAVLLIGAWVAVGASKRLNRNGRVNAALWLLVAGLLAAMGGCAALIWALRVNGLDPTAHAWDATCWLLALWVCAHVGIGMLIIGYCAAGIFWRKITPAWDADLGNVALYWHFVGLSVVVTLTLLGLFPLLRATP
ncbi:cbb3-type cytochrome c oxidase subunit I [Paracoccus sp. Z118]|uniref:cbb3-type cytochrome c oxidase subunit I n=1 Tax=Paracoccus sp. Z118 TaxID=2851017 RepID=UPI001C2CAB99|nr:cbb3-type cytochrome c oxidase subunit I [Paracoccus sp. Z118]MBV0892306.1 cbb3-type cytochrome c oxidase subunit I [Paracoccus sp. Z118]